MRNKQGINNKIDGKRVVICAAFRSPMVKARTFFKNISAPQLGHIILREMMSRLDFDQNLVDEVIIGNVRNPYNTPNIGRVIALEAGLSQEVSCFTVNRNCASGLQAIYDGFLRIKAGEEQIVVAGGVESMSGYSTIIHPRLVDLAKELMEIDFSKDLVKLVKTIRYFKKENLLPIDTLRDGLVDPFCGLSMGQTAELLSREFKVTREAQDEFALISHKKSMTAISSGRFKEEVIGVPLMPFKDQIITADTIPRDHLGLESLTELSPKFEKNGTVTAGNSCPLTDGSAFVLLAEKNRARELNLPIIAELKGFSFVGLNPMRMGLGPVYAISNLAAQTGIANKNIDLYEINEAFAAQIIANMIALRSPSFYQNNLPQFPIYGEIDPAKLNVNGGAISLGHPFGATGVRLVVTLVHEMIKRDLNTGLVALPIGGGQGAAALIERAG